MSQAKTANTVKRQFRRGLMTKAEAVKTLRDRTDYSTAFILAAVRKWEKERNA